MEYISKLLQIAKRHGVSAKQEFVELPLYVTKEKSQFGRFLATGRVMPFLQFKLLFHLGFETKVLIGYKEVTYDVYEDDDEYKEDDPRKKVYGPHLIDKVYSAKEIFEYLLYRLSFSAVSLPFFMSPRYERRMTGRKILPPLQEHGDLYDEAETFILLRTYPLIVTESSVYIAKDDPDLKMVRGIIAEHKKAGDAFLKRYAKGVAVPHALYIDWLMRWFPGAIKVRALVQK